MCGDHPPTNVSQELDFLDVLLVEGHFFEIRNEALVVLSTLRQVIERFDSSDSHDWDRNSFRKMN